MKPSLKAELDKLAERDQRSLSSWIEAELQRIVTESKQKNPAEAGMKKSPVLFLIATPITRSSLAPPPR
jgi:hypothetical protein